MKQTNEIPKKIHNCWFGRGDKPEIVKTCMKSWHTHLSDYEFVEWNEDNFDIYMNPYVSEAYKAKKFAFVSDFVRVYVLCNYGGIYLDTDVEVFKSFDDLLYHDSFWGFEQENFIATSTIGSKPNNKLIQTFLDAYQNTGFINDDGTYNDLTNVAMITEILKHKGVQLNGEYQVLEEEAVFYPQTYFSPYDYINCRSFISENTYAKHHFYKSWLPARTRLKSNIKLTLARIIGGNNIAKLRALMTK